MAWGLGARRPLAAVVVAAHLGAGCEAGESGAEAGPPDAVATEDAGSADAAEPEDAATEDWGAAGPFRVGYLETSLTYAPPDGSPDRTLRLALWYPTDAMTGEEVAYRGLLPAPEVLGGVPLAATDGPLPVVLFSHGNTSFAEQSHFLTTFLASHGHVVAAPDHTGNSLGAGDPPASMFHWRPADLSAVLDHLLDADAPALLAGRLSATAAVTGHSFGGYTALAATGGQIDVDHLGALCDDGALPIDGCTALRTHEALYRAGFGDPRIVASVPMTPGAVVVFGAAGLDGVAVPTLLMTGALDRTTPDATNGDPAWTALAGDARNLRAIFSTGGHFTFTNGCDLAPDVLREDGCGEAFIPPATAHRAINALTLAFLRRHLAQDDRDAALLAGDVALTPDLTLVRGGSLAADAADAP